MKITISKVLKGENIVRGIGSYSYIGCEAPEDGIVIVTDKSNSENMYIRFSDLETIVDMKNDSFVVKIDSWR